MLLRRGVHRLMTFCLSQLDDQVKTELVLVFLKTFVVLFCFELRRFFFVAHASLRVAPLRCGSGGSGYVSLQVAAPLAIICGGDSGVKMTDALSELMGLRSNGGAANRRDKQVQQERRCLGD